MKACHAEGRTSGSVALAVLFGVGFGCGGACGGTEPPSREPAEQEPEADPDREARAGDRDPEARAEDRAPEDAACDPDAAPFGGGDGSEDAPYRLCAPEHIRAWADGEAEEDAALALKADIDLAELEAFEPIGRSAPGENEVRAFGGTFDGQGYALRNLEYASADEDEEKIGFVAETTSEAVLRDVSIEGVDLEVEGSSVGALVGEHAGRIEAVAMSGQVRGGGESENVGGLAGYNSGEIVDCEADAEVDGRRRVGALVGYSINTGRIARSAASGRVSGTHPARRPLGGLVGSTSGEVERSYAETEVEGGRVAGGLAGLNGGEIRRSFAVGSVAGGSNVGGLVGGMGFGGEIEESYAAGAVDDGARMPGGLVGVADDADPAVTNSYFDEDTSGAERSDGGEPLATGAFGERESFEDWDFDDTWELAEAPDGHTRPVLEGPAF